MTPGQNYGKDSYTIDLTGTEATYWLGTESGLLGVFHFEGACTAGDGSCDVKSLSMGADFFNLNSLEWLTEKPLTPPRLHEQRSNQSHKVGREEEGMSSNRPELVVLRECLEAHPDNENLLYLTDRETTLQAINKWIGGGAKLSLAKTADTDILRVIIVNLQQRVKAKAANLLIKVKAHHGCPLNEEADIRAEMGRMMDPDGQQQNATESRGNPSLPCIREGSGEMAKGAHAEKRQRKYLYRGARVSGGQRNLGKRNCPSLMPHQKGPITSTFTADWFLREGQGRELLGEWMKLTSARSQDQRRMLQVNSHTFPTNAWIHKITKGKESDRCDLCRVLWTAEGRFRTEKDLPEQTLGHIQHACEALSATHIDSHHQCWRLIHGELSRLTAPE